MRGDQYIRLSGANSTTTAKKEVGYNSREFKQRAVIVAADFAEPGSWTLEDRLEELAELAISAGAEVVYSAWQRRSRPDPAYLIGPGKVAELVDICRDLQAELVIFDHDLTPAQLRNLEQRLDCAVIDRTQLILDIFAQRARTREGKLQVELAQLQYLLPRLAGRGQQLSRLGAGIGTRGPGETKLETDRRRIRKRIRDLSAALEKVQRDRRLQRKQRKKSALPLIALVGYTNAGKSTLLKALTGADPVIADQLFATLDPKTKRLHLPYNQLAVVADTVGFIHGLPHQLIAAFKATLEHVVEADLLLHVVDISHPLAGEMVAAVNQVLQELGVAGKPRITALNKWDRLNSGPDRGGWSVKPGDLPNPVFISALHGHGLDELRQTIAAVLSTGHRLLSVVIPYNQLHILETVYKHGVVLEASYSADGVSVQAKVHPQIAAYILGLLEQAGETASHSLPR